jgi:hypothetical protein
MLLQVAKLWHAVPCSSFAGSIPGRFSAGIARDPGEIATISYGRAGMPYAGISQAQSPGFAGALQA